MCEGVVAPPTLQALSRWDPAEVSVGAAPIAIAQQLENRSAER
jgi:hypothetical protein